MKQRQLQRGSAHAVIIIVLVVALLGALGYIYWQNFVGNQQTNGQTDTKTTTDAVSPVTTSYGDLSLTLDAPKEWKVEKTDHTMPAKASQTMITSPSGKVGVDIMIGEPYLDGACGLASVVEINKYPTKIDNLQLFETTSKFEGDGGYTVQAYVLPTAGVMAKGLKVGENPCVMHGNKWFTATGAQYDADKDKVAARVSIYSKDDLSDARDLLKLEDYKTARQIVQTLHK